MDITKEALFTIIDGFSNTTCETGGIIGAKKEKTVNCVIFDQFRQSNEHPCCYSPNVDFLNGCIEDWQNNSIQFLGIFHSHLENTPTLSKMDIQYIREIVDSMPDSIEQLYFPVYVIPQKALVVYCADKNGRIQEEALVVK